MRQVVIAAAFAAQCALAPAARAEESPETQAASAALDFDLSGLRDAAASTRGAAANPAQALRAMAAGQNAARPSLVADGLPDTSRGQVEFSMEMRRSAARKSPEPPAPPKAPSGFRTWLGGALGAAKNALKTAAWFAPTAAGAAIGGFAGAAIGGPVGAGVGAAIGGAAGLAVTGAALLVKLAKWFLETWDRR